MALYNFKIFVTGESRRALQAVATLRTLCDTRLDNDYNLEVIDVLDHPELAEEARVMTTPTIIRTTPAPPARVIGDLGDLEAAATALDFPEPKEAMNDGRTS